MDETIFTVGHSTHTIERFIALLEQHGVTALCDVRSKPYSRMNPQFNREDLKRSLHERGITYVFLGVELGARSDDPACCDHGKVLYDRLSQTELFNKGLERVREGAKKYKVALMCAEKEPLECHRTILVARHLEALGSKIEHIHADGRLESHADTMGRLLRSLNIPEHDMFQSRADMLTSAYRMQGDRIAYSTHEPTSTPSMKSTAR